MIVGILREIKEDEHRVSMTPAGAEVVRQSGHAVLVEKKAGMASGFEDADYAKAGAEIVATPKEVFERSEMILRVKEPQPSEYNLIREGQIYFAYLHLATSAAVTKRRWSKAGLSI